MVLVDTSAWIRFLRSPDSSEGRQVDALLERQDVLLTGVVIAELLQGARNEQTRAALARRLKLLPYQDLTKDGWLRLGEISAGLRERGLTMAMSDLVIAVVALQGNHEIFTFDTDFNRVPGLRLYQAA
jgi:predicted nucleic acid-binding protein